MTVTEVKANLTESSVRTGHLPAPSSGKAHSQIQSAHPYGPDEKIMQTIEANCKGTDFLYKFCHFCGSMIKIVSGNIWLLKHNQIFYFLGM